MAPTPAKLLLAAAAVVCTLSAAAGEEYEGCLPGYQNYGLRWARALGRIEIVTSHKACSARCTQYSDRQYAGGCKGFMTGMYDGYLYCKTYGSYSSATLKESPNKKCAWFAEQYSPGHNSGELGEVHPRTFQQNLGGRCCMNVTFADGGASKPSASLSLGADDTAGASGSGAASSTIIIIAIVAIIALAVLAAVYKPVCGARRSDLGDGQGSEGSQASDAALSPPLTITVPAIESDDGPPTTVLNPALAPGHGETWV